MRVFICEELIYSIEENIRKIKLIQSKMNIENSDIIFFEAYFIYVYAIFESSYCEAMRRMLNAFPEKISGEKQLPLTTKDIYDEYSQYEIITILVEKVIRNINKGSAHAIIRETQSVCSIQVEYDAAYLNSISDYRNQITHENTPPMQKNGLEHNQEKEIMISKYKNFVKYLLEMLEQLSLRFKEKYGKYTKEKMLKSLWNTLFDTPLLNFEACVYIGDGFGGDSKKKVVRFHFDHFEKVSSSISSSEKFFLAAIFQQYNASINERFFKFSDIPMLVSISDKKKIYTFLHIMTQYPYLFNNMNMTETFN